MFCLRHSQLAQSRNPNMQANRLLQIIQMAVSILEHRWNDHCRTTET